jgi:hypothetical protein
VFFLDDKNNRFDTMVNLFSFDNNNIIFSFAQIFFKKKEKKKLYVKKLVISVKAAGFQPMPSSLNPDYL